MLMMVITGSCLLCLSLAVTLWCSAAHSLGRAAGTASDTKRDSETRERDAGSGSDTLSLTEPETRAQLTHGAEDSGPTDWAVCSALKLSRPDFKEKHIPHIF